MPLRHIVSILLLILCLAAAISASSSPPMRERGTITCTTELMYRFGNGGSYFVKGPSLSSAQYAPWDVKIDEYYGDVVSFHANGCRMPDIQPEFYVAIAHRVCDRIKLGFPEPLCVYLSLGDNRRNGSGGIKEGIDFKPGDYYTMSLNIENQDRLWHEKRFGDDWLASVSLTCKRKPNSDPSERWQLE